MDVNNVLDIFRRLSGLDSEQAAYYMSFCTGAVSYVSSRLSGDADSSVTGQAEYAAAALAYYRYMLMDASNNLSSEMKVGDISMKADAFRAADAAEKLCRDAFSAISRYLTDEDFAFRGV